jgi:penicillin V acylase-like amidase (Ntn superfamily)
MKSEKVLNRWIFLIMVVVQAQVVFPCSTFMLKREDCHLYGHNLDSGSPVPGLVVINKRNITKESRTWKELSTGKKDDSISFQWTSKFGSVTFNPFGREFPDGGMNETGLIVQEMSLSNTEFPDSEGKRKMFMMLWMQYVLDCFETVEQVIQSASEIVLDGWGWHFFTADKYGGHASIEFIDGRVVVNSGKEMPFPLMCNSIYSKELEGLKTYQGFGGTKPIDVEESGIPRFVRGVYLLKNYTPSQTQSPVDYGFRILENIALSDNKWKYVFDWSNRKVYYRTANNQKVRSLSFLELDFNGESPSRIVDIDVGKGGSVIEQLKEYSKEANEDFVMNAIKTLEINVPIFKNLLSPGGTPQILIEQLTTYPETTVYRNK